VLGGKPHAGITGCSPTTNFTLTNTQATPTLTVTPTSLSLTYGQPVTLNAVLSPLSIAGSGPTGTVTFFDGEDSLTPASTVTNAAASYPISVPTTGPHSYTGGYSGDANFSLTHSIPVPVTVNKASVTATYSVNSPVFVVSGQSGSIPFTLNGQFNGPGIAVPSGSDMLYAIVDSGSVTVQSGQLELSSASATVPISNTLSPGVYTVTLQYGGDGNYLDNQSLATIGLQVGQLQPVINWTTPTPIPYGAGLYGILDAVAVSNQQPSDNVRVRRQTPGQALSGTYSYTATPAAGKAFPVSSVTTLSAGTYTLTVNFTPDPSIASVYTTATGSVRLSVLQVPPGNQLSADVNPVLKLNPVTFTAIMTGVGQEPAVVGSRGIQARARGNESNGGANPTGSVTFLDGATPLGTATVDEGGIATFVTSALAVGSHPVTALYSGDSNYIAATSGQVTELVQDFNLTISISGGGSAGTTSVTTTPGGTAIYSFTLSPVGSATFPATVTLSASGLPANATYTFLPASLPAGSGPTPVTLTIVLAPVTAASLQPAASHAGGTVEGTKASNSPRLPYLALALLLLPFAGRMRKTGRKLGRLLPLLVLLISGVAATMGITGCGSSSTGYFGQASKTYTIAVTGTSGSLTHSTTVTLTVQ